MGMEDWIRRAKQEGIKSIFTLETNLQDPMILCTILKSSGLKTARYYKTFLFNVGEALSA